MCLPQADNPVDTVEEYEPEPVIFNKIPEADAFEPPDESSIFVVNMLCVCLEVSRDPVSTD